jgi:hypothetical protein
MALFKRRKEKKEKPKPVEIKIDYDRIDNFFLRRYGLQDIEHKASFLALNILFFFSGVISLVVFLYGKVNILNIVGTPVTVLAGLGIFRKAKKYGVKLDKHPAGAPSETLRSIKKKDEELNPQCKINNKKEEKEK